MDKKNMFSLEGKIALITGGAHGIGFAIAESYAEAGATVVFNCSSEASLERGLTAYKEKGIDAHGYVCDVTDEEAVKKKIADIEEKIGTVDILVNNAGIIHREDAVNVTEASWDLVTNLNEKLVFFLSQAMTNEFFIPQGGGKIINIASMLSFQGGIRVPSYTSSKSAVMGLTKALANEWASLNINVNAIAPGYMATNNTTALRQDSDRNDAILCRIPAGCWGTSDDLMGAAVFLASDASSYVNGFTLAVDGGWLAR